MEFNSPVQMKYFADLKLGEICQVEFGTRPALSFPIAIDGTRRLIAILKLGAEVKPMVHEVRNLRTPCLSFGDDWVLAPEVEQNFVKSSGHSETAGSIHFHPDGATMYLTPFNRESMMEGYQLAIPTLSHGPIPHDSIAILKWKIWISEAERARVGATPLLEFSHQ
ncbi:hypothetical protein [Rhizobium ruizarguesonis]|uniref:hypothetical protein n=1 Tax=Rhizobium ruizarguesonis TaxID=2081791 RepID=UPI001030E755|nr:hypothetical protein [Rhizobium ruizarguesonis]TBA38404.1 hypothetical protein ELH60_13780 [Rhizobium ruizarguesonis]